MARGLIGWLVGGLAACLVVGAVYLPPRGMPRWAWAVRRPMAEASEPRLRARALAQEWRVAQAELVGAQYRQRLSPVLAARRAQDRPGPVLVVLAADSIRPWAEGVAQAGLDSAWARLGLGVTKVSVGVVLGEGPALLATPITVVVDGTRGSLIYMLPDSTDRSTCLVVGSLPYFVQTRRFFSTDRMTDWAGLALGPCAFYARFGVPGQRVERWLGRRKYDLARSAGWSQPFSSEWMFSWMLADSRTGRWWWDGVYRFPFSVLACFAGREDACRRSIADGDGGSGGPAPRLVVPDDPWDLRKLRLFGGHQFLSEVARTAGEDRFQDFWTTSLPVDSALSVALHQSVGGWTAHWLRRVGPPLPLGAAPNPLDVLLGLGTVVAVLALLMVGQARRQVR